MKTEWRAEWIGAGAAYRSVSADYAEPIPGDWKMLSSSHEHTKSEAFTAEFQVPVQKDGETKVTYRVRMKY